MKTKILISVFLLISFTSFSQPIVEDVLEEAEQIVSEAINQAGTHADFLIHQMALELNLTIQNARLLLKKDMKKNKEQLKGAKLEAYNTIDKLLKEVKIRKAELATTLESSILDLEAIVGGLKWYESQKYTIKRVSWTNQLYDTVANFKFKIMATNIGLNDSKLTTAITELKIDSKSIEGYRLIPLEDKNEALIEIENKYLLPYFDKEKVNPISIDLTFLYNKKRLFFNFKDEFSIQLYLYLFPLKAGSLNVYYNKLEKDWVYIGTKSGRHYTGHSNHCKKDCEGHDNRVTPYDFRINVPSTKSVPPELGDQKLANPRGGCDGGFCAWFRFDTPPKLENNDTQAYCRYRYWSHATGCRLTADLYEYRVIEEQPVSKEYVLYFGELLQIRVPSDYTSGNIGLKYLDNTAEYTILGKNINNLKLLNIHTPVNQDYTEYTYKVVKPDIYK